MTANINRRALAKGAAWAAPAISIAAAAPSLAASDSPEPEYREVEVDKCPGASDVPGGWPKHGYRMIVRGWDRAPRWVIVSLVNGGPVKVVAGPTPVGPGAWEYVLDAKSSPSKLTVLVEGELFRVKAHPHCGDTR